MASSKQIKIKEKTDDRLALVKADRLEEGDTFTQSYDDIINHLIDFYRDNK